MDPLTFIAISVFVAALLLDRHFSRNERRSDRDAYAAHLSQILAQHVTERRELANRIQHPHLIPTTRPRPVEDRPPRDSSQLARVGTAMPMRDTPPGED